MTERSHSTSTIGQCRVAVDSNAEFYIHSRRPGDHNEHRVVHALDMIDLHGATQDVDHGFTSRLRDFSSAASTAACVRRCIPSLARMCDT